GRPRRATTEREASARPREAGAPGHGSRAVPPHGDPCGRQAPRSARNGPEIDCRPLDIRPRTTYDPPIVHVVCTPCTNGGAPRPAGRPPNRPTNRPETAHVRRLPDRPPDRPLAHRGHRRLLPHRPGDDRGI